MLKRRLSKEEIGERGMAIYRENLQNQLEGSLNGQYVAIDVETSEYEIADEPHLASRALRNRLADPQVFVERIGHRAVFRAL